jgi:hypothetical protein
MSTPEQGREVEVRKTAWLARRGGTAVQKSGHRTASPADTTVELSSSNTARQDSNHF